MEHFFTLTPELMLDAIERALPAPQGARRATGRTLTLNSMENRVYEVELDDASRVVAKFYRPGRWSRETILEEHEFIAELKEAEVPVVAPFELNDGGTLAQSADGIYFAVYPKVRGRILQELSDQQLLQVGRYLGRLHNVGARMPARHRLALNPATYGFDALRVLERSGLIPAQAQDRYVQIAQGLIEAIVPFFDKLKIHRVHGDCHLGNVLWSGGGNESMGTFILDFDDMLMGPAVQDIWMVVRGRDEEARRQRDVLLEGYEQMRAFDRQTLRLVEPLRALRMIHYAAWIAKRWDDPIFKGVFPDFTTLKHWSEEIVTLDEQRCFIE